jgi:hypothetical protein
VYAQLVLFSLGPQPVGSGGGVVALIAVTRMCPLKLFSVAIFFLGPLPVGTGGGSIGLIATQEQLMKLSSFCSKVSYHPQIDLFSISPLPVGTGVGNGPNWIQQH